MKKNFFYAGVLTVLFASCSNEDGVTSQAGPGQTEGDVVNELKISLVSGMNAGTKTVGGTGTENTLYNAWVFVKADENGPDASNNNQYDYKYTAVGLTQGQSTAVVKHVQANSKVYVFANNPVWTEATVGTFITNLNNDPTNADKQFQELKQKIEKTYVSGLNTTNGQFIMSGMAIVPTLSNTGATVLAVNLKRDLAKVTFQVKKQSTEVTTRIKEVEEITVRRSADHIQPFAMSGTSLTTYVLPYGFGDPNYKQDGIKDGVLSPENDTQTTDATDFTFVYTSKDVITTANDFTFSNFYVLPNAANVAEKGTIIVLKAKIEKSTTTDGNTTWEEVQGFKYYKARISSGQTAYNTAQNSSYTIIATIKGEGNNDPSGPSGPDAEDTDGNLNINVQVEDWKLVLSNQEIE